MEAEKLMNVLEDIINENTNTNIQDEINILINSIQQNQSKDVDSSLGNIKEFFTNSTFNEYSLSNYKILEYIKGDKYYGNSGWDNFNEILNKTPYDNNQTIANLQKYVKDRNEFIVIVTPIRDNFEKLKIDPHFYSDNIFEMGLLIPEKVSENKIKFLIKHLSKWDRLIKTAKELTGQGVIDTKLTMINKGSLELFSELTPEIAMYFSIILEKLVALYLKFKDIREASDTISKLGGPKQQKEIQKFEKENINKTVDSISQELIKKFADKKIESERLNEITVAVKGDIMYVAKALDDGLFIEINPPEISEPDIITKEETEENKLERTKAKKTFDQQLEYIKTVQKVLKTTKSIIGTSKNVFKTLTTGESEESEESEE